MKKGFIALVGAGPGEVSLLTLRAKELLENAEVVVYDKLVSDDILELIPQNAEKINVGKQSRNHLVPQEGINDILVRLGLEGKNAVRLKGGDPFVFGRGGEELEALIEHDIPFEVVPGITSAVAAAAFAGIPVTHRNICSSFHVITGHQKQDEPLNIDFESLVKTRGTLVFLMGLASLNDICKGLINAGMEEDMPAALVQYGTRSNQRKLIATVSTLRQKAIEQKFISPAIIIVGGVCVLSDSFDWFSKRELFGKEIIVTSPKTSENKLAKTLKAKGATVHHLPMIEIEKLKFDINNIDLSAYTWLVFTSKNGVEVFFDALYATGKDARALNSLKIAAVGPSTKHSLLARGIIADITPSDFNGLSLAQKLAGIANKNDNMLLLRAQKASDELPNVLKNARIKYNDVKIYTVNEIAEHSEKLVSLTQKQISVAFTSASTVHSFMQNNVNTKNVNAFCIGEETLKAAQQYFENCYVAKTATITALAEKITEELQ